MGVTSGTAGRLSSSGRQVMTGRGVLPHRERSSSMSRPAAGRRLQRHRFGICHRCGWKALVSRVGRDDHLRIGSGRAFGRLCDDCFDTLLGAPSFETSSVPAPVTAVPRPLAGAGLAGRVLR
jgi:hypothetical protein